MRPTVGGAFRASLRALSATLLETTQHFIRCIKPNGTQEPDAFNGRFISRQLRYNGVHAVVDIHRSGYPVKYLQKRFVGRYKCIAFDQPKLISDSLPSEVVCRNLLQVAHKLAPAGEDDGGDRTVNGTRDGLSAIT